MNQKLIRVIRRYQRSVSPYIAGRGVHCLYVPSCSRYAIQCLESRPLIVALFHIVFRLLCCNPLNAYLKSRRKEKQRA